MHSAEKKPDCTMARVPFIKYAGTIHDWGEGAKGGDLACLECKYSCFYHYYPFLFPVAIFSALVYPGKIQVIIHEYKLTRAYFENKMLIRKQCREQTVVVRR